jgi:hypothetical protein
MTTDVGRAHVWNKVRVTFLLKSHLVLVINFIFDVPDFLHYLFLTLHKLVILAAEIFLVKHIWVSLVARDTLRLVQENNLGVVLLHECWVFFEALLKDKLLPLVIEDDNDVGFEGLDGIDNTLALFLGLGTE